MFSNLKLFSYYSCPDPLCKRPKCMFSHSATQSSTGVESSRTTKPQAATVPSAKRPRLVEATQAPTQSNTQRGLSPKEQQFSTIPAKRPPRPQYEAILPQHPTLAHESTLAQELEVSNSTSNLKAYKLAVHQAAVNVSRRPKPDTFPHPSIGTVKESRAATEAAELAKASRLTRERVEKYLPKVEELVSWGYPDFNNPAIQSTDPNPPRPTAEGTLQACDRCKREFVVTAEQEHGTCLYHHGRPAPERQEGRRVWIFTCCGRERGTGGCEESVHVFSHKENDEKLAEVAPYMTTKEVVAQRPGGSADKAFDVVGMDCEMIYTTAGTSLARVSIVDEDGAVLLDELVRQREPVLDYNTRYSGVRDEDMKAAVMDLGEVRSACCAFIGPETVIVGHGLENDLRALRLLHDRVIDTAILFPHEKGRPYRRALRDLVREKLGFFIQDRTADLGHSSAVDAKATLDVLKWKVRKDAE